jgi:hypothetical protein
MTARPRKDLPVVRRDSDSAGAGGVALPHQSPGRRAISGVRGSERNGQPRLRAAMSGETASGCLSSTGVEVGGRRTLSSGGVRTGRRTACHHALRPSGRRWRPVTTWPTVLALCVDDGKPVRRHRRPAERRRPSGPAVIGYRNPTRPQPRPSTGCEGVSRHVRHPRTAPRHDA